MSCYEKILQERLETTQESLRQAVASIDRLTAERAPRFVFSPEALRDLPGVTASPPDYPLSHYKHTIVRLKDDVVKYQRQLSALEESTREKDARHSDLVTARNALYDEVVQLRRANQAHVQEIAEMKRRPCPPEDWAEMAELGRFTARLFRRGHLVAEHDISTIPSRLRVTRGRTWIASYLNPGSRLGQFVLRLTK